jgi:hypothetical protein
MVKANIEFNDSFYLKTFELASPHLIIRLLTNQYIISHGSNASSSPPALFSLCQTSSIFHVPNTQSETKQQHLTNLFNNGRLVWTTM